MPIPPIVMHNVVGLQQAAWDVHADGVIRLQAYDFQDGRGYVFFDNRYAGARLLNAENIRALVWRTACTGDVFERPDGHFELRQFNASGHRLYTDVDRLNNAHVIEVVRYRVEADGTRTQLN